MKVTGSFQETASRKTAENTVKHCDVGAGLVVGNYRGGGEISVVITTLVNGINICELVFVLKLDVFSTYFTF